MSEIRKSAIISEDGKYRYRLDRFWSGEHALVFVMLNPSTADANIDDPTIRRCMGFARREGAGGIIVVNLFALRATDPFLLTTATNPIGPQNREIVASVFDAARRQGVPIICAWGACKSVKFWREALNDRGPFMCLGKTRNGSPRHPLYVRANQPFEVFP